MSFSAFDGTKYKKSGATFYYLGSAIPMVAFPFITDALSRLDYRIKPMFGSHALYVGEKIMIIMRDRESHPEANGVWIATAKEHHESLKKQLPSICSVDILSDGKGETNWRMIPLESDSFETECYTLCELILKNDPRIGRVPKPKKKKKSS